MEVIESDVTGGLPTALRRTVTSYLFGSPYIRASGVANNANPANDHRWLVGLPTAVYQYDGANNLTAKVSYAYDQATYGQENLLVHQTPAAGTIFNFDTKYALTSGATAITARGNVTNVTRWDVTSATNPDNAVVRATQYNTTGSPTTQYLPNNNNTGRKTILSYQDAWADSSVNNTLAYPTTITDPDSKSSMLQYRYDIGAVATTTDPKGATYTRTYDPGSGRLLKIQNSVNQAYTRYVEGVGLSGLATYTKVLAGPDFGQPGFNPASEYFSAVTIDGHGRTVAQTSDHPGSTGGYRTVYNAWDPMGRLQFTTPPTETDAYWNSTGDDAIGYPQIFQEYDWKGRPTVTWNADFTTKTITYGGCGCAGGEVITTTDEVGRQQRVTRDAYLDTTTQVDKTEILNSNGTTYSTTATIYKSNERKVYVREYPGATTSYLTTCTGTNCQESWTQSDGHGRAFQQHRVIEAGTHPYTEFEYYADDTVKKATDARGVITNYNYYARGLVQNMSYALTGWANAGIQTSSTVSYEYDSIGKRKKMIDGLGQVDYTYDTLNRLTAEARTFSNLTGYNSSNFISQNNVIATYTLAYEYDLANRLTKLTDPWGGSVSYQPDTSGRITSITANGYGNYDAFNNTPITNIVSNTKYRAWDALKQLDTGTTASLAHFEYSYNARLLPTQINQGGRITNQTYYDDGKLQDATNNYRAAFNSHFEYDHAGRIKLAKAGNNTDWTKNPYFFVYEYNAFGDTLKRTGDQQQSPPGTTPGHHWSQQLTDFTATWTNHRDGSLQYDAIGNLGSETDYNQAGLLAQSDQPANALVYSSRYHYDGDGKRAYANAYYRSPGATPPANTPAGSYANDYYLRSSVLGGQVVASFSLSPNTGSGMFYQSYTVGMFFNGSRVAEYCYKYGLSLQREVKWVYDNPVTGSRYEHVYKSYSSGAPPFAAPGEDSESDPVGGDVGISDPYTAPPPSASENIELDVERITGDIHDYRASCKVDGAPVACSEVMGRLNSPALFDWARSVHFGPFARAIGIISVFAGPDWRSEGRGGEVVTGVGRRIKFILGQRETKAKATEAVNKFLARSPGCRKFLNGLLENALEEAEFLDATQSDDEIFNKSTYEVGARSTDSVNNENYKKGTIRDEVSTTYALTIGNKIFTGSFQADAGKYDQALTYIHELVHVALRSDFANVSHISVAIRLGLGFQLKKDEKGNILYNDKADGYAGYLLDDFLLQDCNSNFVVGFASEKEYLKKSNKRLKELFK